MTLHPTSLAEGCTARSMNALRSGTGSKIAPSGAYVGSLKDSTVPNLTVEQRDSLQLNLTEKGLRKVMEMSKSYRHALFNADVLETFKVILSSLLQSRKGSMCPKPSTCEG